VTPRPVLDRMLAALHRFAEAVAAALLAVIFVAVIVQIDKRYVFNWPAGWTTELSLVAWLWLVLWGAAFVLKDDEEIRIDLLVILGVFIGGVATWLQQARWAWAARRAEKQNQELRLGFDRVRHDEAAMPPARLSAPYAGGTSQLRSPAE